jgi:tetratricopeptide (TPR) repeat protein
MEFSHGTDADYAYYRLLYLQALTESGRLEDAEELAAPIVEDFEKTPDDLRWSQWLALSILEHGRGNTDSAISHARRAIQVAGSPVFHLYHQLALYCIEDGRAGEAVEALEYALGRYDELRLSVPTHAAMAYFHLGIAYEMSGWNDKALEQYQVFLDLWKDSDLGIPVVEEAQERLERLRASS